MKKLAIALALVALLGFNVTAQDSGSGKTAKNGCDAGVCTTGTLVKKQDEAKKACGATSAKLASKPQDEKKAPKTDEVIKRGACHGKLSSGCETLDGYLAAEKAAAKGCETSKAKLASMSKADPKLPEMAKLYKSACNGCEDSAAKLAAMSKAPQEEPKKAKAADCGSACESGAKVVKAGAKSDCCGDSAKGKLAKVGAKSDCGSCEGSAPAKMVKFDAKKGSGCETLDGYLAAEKAAAKGCETSKAKLASMSKANPKLPEMAKLYKSACNGCESSAAKLAAMSKAPQEEPKKAKAADCGSACESGAKVVKAGAKSDCGSAKGRLAKAGAKADCSSCEGSAPAKMVKFDAKKGSGCETLDGYLAAEKAAAKGCETSKAKLAEEVAKANPELPKIATLYKNACNGCESSAAKLAEMQKAAKKAPKSDCGSSCESDAKVIKAETKSDCGSCEGSAPAKMVKFDAKKGSGCETLDGYLSAEKAAAKGCETSKAKLATMTKANPELPKIAKLYKNACNGCESSAAKLAEMQKAAKKAPKSDCGSSCEGEGKLIEKKALINKTECQDACGDACGDACEEGKTIGAKKAPKVIKADCCGGATNKGPEPKSAMKEF